ncbi:Ribosome production factor 1 [Exophiala dermatitidis]|uniref:Brix-domain ribosomal biogenesis protein n=1 Tax=Exophiala dermatitidis (strain ATCC 34100 / CBS 525.76 / NIH/UT8656) TaxID=858893 RepID=H6BZ51_EXODN|nr:brix-domain ribosomal biogenesis protein [Exophiala dermatitidis NIH/UT8656]EHY56914.1 brix-domain ribosomal biogenesis protein [Exophiala dermatitidis NIH/UT8656]
MPSRTKLSDKAALPFRTANKQKRQELHLKQKRARDALKRAERFGRKKEEAKNPQLREERLRRNIPITIDKKRVYDEVEDEPEDGGLGMVYDVERMKRRKLAEEQRLELAGEEEDETPSDDDDEDHDSMLDESESDREGGSHSEEEEEEDLEPHEAAHDPLPSKSQILRKSKQQRQPEQDRAASPTRSTTSTNLSLAPAALAAKFPTLFLSPDAPPPPDPKILITTSINSTLHDEAAILTSLFPNSKYIRRSSHRYGYKFSVREISSFAHNQGYTAVIVLEEDQKRPSGMTVVHLPQGPTFHFSISNWYTGKAIPGHGRATDHKPELILNNFTTPLGLVTAHLFRSLFPATPQLQGRQVLTLHNQRDYIFVRRHRYIFREKRETEKSVVGPDGKEVKGVEGIRAGLQELGPRFTLKLRRVDKGIQRRSGQDWEWKAKMEKTRTKFQL